MCSVVHYFVFAEALYHSGHETEIKSCLSTLHYRKPWSTSERKGKFAAKTLQQTKKAAEKHMSIGQLTDVINQV